MITENLIEVCQKFDITFIVLFGSQARGMARPGSDVDVGVWIKTAPITAERELELVRALVLATRESNLDVTILNYAHPLLGYHVVLDGLLLCERQDRAFDQYRLWAWKRYLDAAKFRKLESMYVEAFLAGDIRHARQTRNRA